jgi:hypothetical protein
MLHPEPFFYSPAAKAILRANAAAKGPRTTADGRLACRCTCAPSLSRATLRRLCGRHLATLG